MGSRTIGLVIRRSRGRRNCTILSLNATEPPLPGGSLTLWIPSKSFHPLHRTSSFPRLTLARPQNSRIEKYRGKIRQILCEIFLVCVEFFFSPGFLPLP